MAPIEVVFGVLVFVFALIGLARGFLREQHAGWPLEIEIPALLHAIGVEVRGGSLVEARELDGHLFAGHGSNGRGIEDQARGLRDLLARDDLVLLGLDARGIGAVGGDFDIGIAEGLIAHGRLREDRVVVHDEHGHDDGQAQRDAQRARDRPARPIC